MIYIPEPEKHGYCEVYAVHVALKRLIARNEREPLLHACQNGVEWYDAVDLFGDIVHLRCSEISDIADCSPEAMLAYRTEADEKRKAEALNGE